MTTANAIARSPLRLCPLRGWASLSAEWYRRPCGCAAPTADGYARLNSFNASPPRRGERRGVRDTHMTRYSLVLAAVVREPASRTPHPRFGIFALWSFARSNVGVDIGPNHQWYQGAREHRVLTDEALRVLRAEFKPEQLVRVLLSAVPAATDRVLIASDSPSPWVLGRHPEHPWVYHFEDLFGVINSPPPVACRIDGASSDSTRSACRPRKNITARMLQILFEDPTALDWTVRRWADVLHCAPSTVAETAVWRRHIHAARALYRAERIERDARCQP